MLDELVLQIRKGNIETVKQLLEKGADPNGYLDQDKVAPLHHAAQLGTIAACQITALLLYKGANPLAETIDEVKPVDVAKLFQNEALVKLLTAAEASSLS